MAAKRMPSYLGLYLALTGARVTSPSDLLALGMATHFVPEQNLKKLREELQAHDFTPCSDADLLHTVEHHTAAFPAPAEDGLQANVHVVKALMAPGLSARRAGSNCVEALQAIVDAVDDMVRLPSRRACPCSAAQQRAARCQRMLWYVRALLPTTAWFGVSCVPCKCWRACEPLPSACMRKLSHTGVSAMRCLQAASDDTSDEATQFARRTQGQLRAGAPRSLALTLEHMHRAYADLKAGGPTETVPGCLSREFNVRTRC